MMNNAITGNFSTVDSFAAYVSDNIRQYITDPILEGANIRVQQVVKNNDRRMTGLSVTPEGKTTGFCVYLDDLYNDYDKGLNLDDVMGRIADTLVTTSHAEVPDTRSITNYEEAKKHLSIRLLDPEFNRELLKDKIYTVHGSFAALYCVELPEVEGTCLITKSLFDSWDIDLETLTDDALRSTHHLGAHLYSVSDFIDDFSMFGAQEDEISEKDLFLHPERFNPFLPLYLLTNNSKSYGASTILIPGILDKVADVMGDDFYVLPSSVHEVLTIPAKETDPSSLQTMVDEINATVVEKQDFLSGKIHRYNRETHSLELYTK